MRNGLAGTSSASSGFGLADLLSRSASSARSAASTRRAIDRITGRQRVPGGGHQPLGDRPGDPQFPVRGEPDEPGRPPARPTGPGRRTPPQPDDRPWCPTHPATPRSTRGTTGPAGPAAGSSSPSGSPTRRVRCAAHAVNSTDDFFPGGDRTPRPASTSSVIASRSIASVFTRRRPATRRCSPTCAGLSSSTSQPAGHADGDHRQVVMPGRLDTDLHHPPAGSTHRPATTSRSPGPVIANSTGPNNRRRPASVTDNATQFLPTSTATTTVDDHTPAQQTRPTSGQQAKSQAAQHPALSHKEPDQSLLAPPEIQPRTTRRSI